MRLKYTNKNHAYYFEGKRCKSVTTVAKIAEDDFNLIRWKARQTAIGLARSPHLIESIAAHHTDRNKLDDLCEQALVAAGAGDAAEYGTAVHRVTERIDAGEDILPTPMSLRIAEQWTGLLEKAGLEIVPELAERVVIYPEQRICGKFDRIVRNTATGKLHIADLKTGASAITYPHSVATQLALYANAPLLAGQWDGLDGYTEEFTDLPEGLDSETGYIIYIPKDPTEKPAVFTIDLGLGWRCVQEIIFPTLRWRGVPASRLLTRTVEL